MEGVWEAIARQRSALAWADSTTWDALTDNDCQLLLAAGLHVDEGVTPAQMYCYQYITSHYDGLPVQVLRLLDEVRARTGLRPQSGLSQKDQAQASSVVPMLKARKSSLPLTGLAMETDQQLELKNTASTTINSTRSSTAALRRPSADTFCSPPQTAKSTTTLSPVDAMQRESLPAPIKVASTRIKSTCATIAVAGQSGDGGKEEEAPVTTRRVARKRKTMESTVLFSAVSHTPSPVHSKKSRRTSILPKFLTPEQSPTHVTNLLTPKQFPSPPKLLSMWSPIQSMMELSSTEGEEDENEAMWDEELGELISEGLEDDDDAADGREKSRSCCCDYQVVLDPVLDAVQRTSARFQNAWQEVRGLSSTLSMVPMLKDQVSSCSWFAHLDDYDDGGGINFDLVCKEDDNVEHEGVNQSKERHGLMQRSNRVYPMSRARGMRTRRQRQAINKPLSSTTWRLW